MNDRPKKARASKRIGRWFKWLFGIVGVGFLVVTFAETWHRSQGLPIPKPLAFVFAGILILAGLMCLARAWITLFPDPGITRSLTAGFYASQLGRYIPGAIWQVLAQVGLATDAGATLPQASAAFGVFALVEVAAGGTLGATLALFGTGLPWVVRSSALLMLIPLLCLRRKWISWTLHLAGRLTRKQLADDLVPAQRLVLLSYAWTLMTLVLSATAFALLLDSLQVGIPFSRSFAAFGFAWTIGFLAIPFPSGIGIREAILILAIGGRASTSYIIGASVSQRLVSIVAELAMIIWSRFASKRTAPGSEWSTQDDLGDA